MLFERAQIFRDLSLVIPHDVTKLKVWLLETSDGFATTLYLPASQIIELLIQVLKS